MTSYRWIEEPGRALVVLVSLVGIGGCSAVPAAPAAPPPVVQQSGTTSSPRAASSPVATLAVANADADADEYAPRGREAVQFRTLGEMVATSLSVVEGDVVAVRPGRDLSTGPDGKHQLTEVVLRVSEVLAGQALTGDILIEDDPVLAAPSVVGDHGIYFLVQKRDAADARYRLATSQGRYRLDASGRLRGSNPANPLVQQLESTTPAGLRTVIGEAAEAVDRGEIKPVPTPKPAP